jgi:holo-[acyl-carrier protein] synthase
MVIGMGIDIQEIAKFDRARQRGGERFLTRTFTALEQAYCLRQKNSSQHFVGRFCAKEAFFKALGTGWAKGLAWHEVEVVRTRSGKPELKLSGRADELARKARVKKTWLSLSHSEGYAAAVVILEG